VQTNSPRFRHVAAARHLPRQPHQALPEKDVPQQVDQKLVAAR